MTTTPPVHFRIVPHDPAAHLFQVTLTVADPDPDGQVLSLASWIPGSYLIREFAKNIVAIRAYNRNGPLALARRDKHTWVAAPCSGPLVVQYEVYAWDLSVRQAHFDHNHGFFNGTSTFLQVHGQRTERHVVEIAPPDDPRCADWKVATSLPRLGAAEWGFGTYQAADWDELIDHPVQMGSFDLVSFEACGVPHHVAVTGRHDGDLDRLARDLVPICETHIRMFGEPAPMDRYVFLLTVVGEGYGGLEHRASTALIAKRADLPRPGDDEVGEGYRGLLGLCSHEYFHTWNVKRIKPSAYTPYDLSQEAYTTLLWAFEGITSYYDDLGLLRSGAIEADSWLELEGRTLTRVMRGTGRLKQSLADSSFDAWTKFYRQDENATNAIVSYYAKGALAALALDLTIRSATHGARSLDDVMRTLWARHGQTGVGVPEDGVEAVASEVAGRDLSAFFDLAIRGTDDLPLDELLAHYGVRLHLRPAESTKDKGGKKGGKDAEVLARRGDLGARVVKSGDGAKLAAVVDGGPARAAGLSAGDVVIAVDGLKITGDALVSYCADRAPGTAVHVHAFRRDELIEADVVLAAPPATTAWLELVDDVDDETRARRDAWLGRPG